MIYRSNRQSMISAMNNSGPSLISGLNEITNMTHWWDCSNEDTITFDPIFDHLNIADQISGWTCFGHVSLKPETGNAANDINGLNVLSFNTGDFMWTTVTNEFPPVVYIGYLTNVPDLSGGPYGGLFSARNYNTTDGRSGYRDFQFIHTNTNNDNKFYLETQSLAANLGTTTNGGFGVIEGLCYIELICDSITAGQLEVKVNGVSQGIASLSDSLGLFSDRFYWNCKSDSSGPLNQRLCEICMMRNNIPTSEEIQQIYTYLSNKWGVTF